METVIIIAGPTASGKTDYALRLALETGAEIVSADSMQIYRHMDIGTAKPPLSERGGVRHHMIDVAEPDARFSVADYQRMAKECLKDITSRKKKAVIVGGTGLYISSLTNNIKYPVYAADRQFRDRLAGENQMRGTGAMHARLADADPQAAARIHINDKKRIIRALEVLHATGMPLSWHESRSRLEAPEYLFKTIGLCIDRGELYRRINERVDDMFKNGLVDEARFLFERYGAGSAAAQAIGYKELFGYFNGMCTLDEAARLIKKATRRYAKRQLTWFRAMPDIIWQNAEYGHGLPV